MIENRFLRWLLFPLSLLYGLGVSLRDFFYRKGLLKGISFDLPVISVGNLSVGGAGKTPHIEFLIRLLKDYVNVGTLSRGYQRKTKGYLEIQAGHSAESAGDEPLQFRRKFPEIMVAVAENRAFAIPQMLMTKPDLQVLLLDDAFQHRSIQPGLNILLTEFHRPFTQDFLLPSGRLREWRAAYRRADLLVVSKCPPQLQDEDRQRLIDQIKPFPNQQIFFSYYRYLFPYYIYRPDYRIRLTEDLTVLLICAIARTDYLLDYLHSQVDQVRTMEFEDHHYFDNYDLGQLLKSFNLIKSDKKLILTTEKDAMRLELHREFILQHQLPIFVLPIEVAFHGDDEVAFSNTIKDFLLNFKA